MPTCQVCNRKLKNPLQTIGKICARKNKPGQNSDQKPIRVERLYRSKTRRSYLVFTAPRRIVEIFTDAGGCRSANCHCNQAEKCEHIAAAAAFETLGGK